MELPRQEREVLVSLVALLDARLVDGEARAS